MIYSREEAAEKLLNSFKTHYNITPYEDEQLPIVARCDYFEHSQKYVLSKKAELWSADCEEFIYILSIPHLTKELFEKWRDYVHEDGMSRIKPGPGHMYSFITPIFLCDTCEEEAHKALKKCRIYKSFHFSLHGWMDFHTAVAELGIGRITANGSGHNTAKIMKKILYKEKGVRVL